MAYKVGAYQFENADEARLAQKELAAVVNISRQLDVNDFAAIQSTYDMLTKNDVFHTAVGLDYLNKLASMLAGSAVNAPDALNVEKTSHSENGSVTEQVATSKDRSEPAATSEHASKSATKSKHSRTKSKKTRHKKVKKQISLERQVLLYKRRANVFMWITVVLAVVVVGMFAITMTSDQPNILNYETKIINKYSSWEEELSEREKAVTEREQELAENE